MQSPALAEHSAGLAQSFCFSHWELALHASKLAPEHCRSTPA
jgi:hypothetical protein